MFLTRQERGGKGLAVFGRWGDGRQAQCLWYLMSGRNLKNPATQMFSKYPDVWHGADHAPPSLPSQEAPDISALTSGLHRVPAARSCASSRLPTLGLGIFFLNLYTWMTVVTRSRFLKAVEAVI